MIETAPVEGSDGTPVIEIGVEQNDPVGDAGMEETDKLY